VTSLTVYYGGVFEHKGNTLAADSSYTYEDENKNQFFEAFGNVVITQPSGTVVYADKLHYDALIQLATLTGNVKMVDATSVLTTNFLTYNMRSKTGTYRTGGRIVSQGDTITSKNAYYFENTSDAYFRHDVVVRTPNVKVYTDSMRYNSVSKETYFFGPTNIKGNDGDNFYTERGTYNTGTGIAKFNLNNLYTEGTKFLKGDSLYYNRDIGIGEAYRNVVFVDTLDKFYAYGGKGVYNQADESILMTEKPLIITVVKNDSTDNASPADSVQVDTDILLDKEKDTVDTAEENPVEADVDSVALKDIAYKSERDTLSGTNDVDSVYMTADTLFSKVILLKDYNPLELNLSRDGGQLVDDEGEDYGDDENSGDLGNIERSDIENSDHIEKDSLSVDRDDLLDQGKKVLAALADSVGTVDTTGIAMQVDSIKVDDVKPILDAVKGLEKEVKKVPSAVKKEAQMTIGQTLAADSVLRKEAVIPTGSEAETKIAEALKVAQTPDSVQNNNIDLVEMDSTKAVSDTARTRIVRAYYNVRLFKSDLQAVADSVYYGMADSMFRFMGRPMIWAQDSQISADTIFMQIINQQLDNALLKDNAFMVNATLDTVKFNQLKGRRITAFFSNNNIDRLFVDGNAENISFSVNEKAKIITEMFHDRGARIKVKLENKEIIDYTTVKGVDQKIYPFNMVTQENEILPGFVWRPQDRPKSKEDLLNRKRELDRKGVSDTSDSTRVDSLGGESGRPSLPLKTDDLDKLEEVDETAVENVQQEAVKSEAVTEEKAGEQKEEEEMHTEEEKEENPPLTLYIKRHSNLFGDVLCAKISFQNDMFAVWPTTLSS
jgi:lipopolysaccharide export system protein LptA